MKNLLHGFFVITAIFLGGCASYNATSNISISQTPLAIKTSTLPPTTPTFTRTSWSSSTPKPSHAATQISSVEIGGGKNQVSYWGENGTIYLINLSGKNEQGFAIGKGRSHSWSPDGSQIVFMDVSETSITTSTIYVTDANGKNTRVLVQSDVPVWDPAWSPNGKQIAYNRDGDIYIINANGTDNKLILHGSSFFGYKKPAWSPSGEQIAFFVPTGLFIANKDGSNIIQVASDTDWSSSASWSPDGQWIAYGCYKKVLQICIIKSDGSDKKVLTTKNINAAPQWSPDGQWIAFESYQDGNWEIYIMKHDGSEQRRITNDPLSNFDPRWRP